MENDEKAKKDFSELCLYLIWEFLTKKHDIDKTLKEIVENKFKKIEKKKDQISKKKKTGIFFLGAGYTGELNKNNQPDGVGSFIYQSEDFYVGETKNGLKHGVGKYTYLGSKDAKYHPFSVPYYIGEWFADSYDGIGKKYITNFEKLMLYEGNFCNDAITGFGTYKKFATDKIVDTEMIGYFVDSSPFWYMIEIYRDAKGNFLTKQPTDSSSPKSGLYVNNPKEGTKNLLFPLYESDWKELENRSFKVMKPHKNKHVIETYKNFYNAYLDLEFFQKKFKDERLKVKSNLYKLMAKAENYFWKNQKNKVLTDLMGEMNETSRSFSAFTKIDEIINVNKKIDNFSKKLNTLKTKLNRD